MADRGEVSSPAEPAKWAITAAALLDSGLAFGKPVLEAGVGATSAAAANAARSAQAGPALLCTLLSAIEAAPDEPDAIKRGVNIDVSLSAKTLTVRVSCRTRAEATWLLLLCQRLARSTYLRLWSYWHTYWHQQFYRSCKKLMKGELQLPRYSWLRGFALAFHSVQVSAALTSSA